MLASLVACPVVLVQRVEDAALVASTIRDALEVAAESDEHRAIVQLLAGKAAELDATRNSLVKAVKSRSANQVQQCLEQARASPTAIEARHVPAEKVDAARLEQLFEHFDEDGDDCLDCVEFAGAMKAVGFWHQERLDEDSFLSDKWPELCFELGVDPTKGISREGWTAFYRKYRSAGADFNAVFLVDSPQDITPLLMASFEGDAAVLSKLLAALPVRAMSAKRSGVWSRH